MGTSASVPMNKGSSNSSTWPRDSLRVPEHRSGTWIFHVVPQDEEIRKASIVHV